MTMTREEAVRKREQLICDGYCLVEDVLSEGFLEELRRESDRLLDEAKHPPEWKYQGSNLNVKDSENAIMHRLVHAPEACAALDVMSLGDFRPHGSVIILSKPPGGPGLYWHQDWRGWNDPISAAPWPQQIFLSYYLVDTTIRNGCLRVISGTHLKRVGLHDHLVGAHEQGAYDVEEQNPHMFSDHAGAIDIPVRAGSLVIADARVLHAAHPNQSDRRRTLLLCWYHRPATLPSYWDGPVPELFAQRPPDAEYEATREPGKYLESRP